MNHSSKRLAVVPVTGAAMLAGVLLTPGTASAGDTSFTSSCQAKSIITVDKSVAATMSVTAPASVAAGETFTYRIQPNASSYPDKDSGATTTNLSRIKYDYAIPDNTTFVSAAIVPGTAVNIDNVAPNVLRVNDSGAVDNAGGILRLSGNNEVVGNSPTSSTNSEGGIRAPKLKKNLDGTANSAGESWYRLPAVDVTVTAVAAGVITPKVRTAGSAASYGNDQNFSTSLAKASLLGTQWAPTRCIPSDDKSTLNAGAGPLATITVTGPVNNSTTTTLTAPATATIGQAVTLSATVAPAAATGTVQFKDGDANLGAAVPLNNGTATLSQTFTTAGAHSITAVYSGDSKNQPSTSAASVVSVTAAIVDTTTTMNVPSTATTGQATDLWATVNAPGNVPAVGGTVQFKDGGADIGGPIALASGGAKLTYTFNAAGAHAISAVYSGAEGFNPSTGAAATVTVSDPAPVELNTTTTLTVPASATKGDAVAFTAEVKTEAGAAVTSGTVRFMDGGTPIGDAVTVVNGKATLQYTVGQTGNRVITAVYTGGTGYKGSTSAPSTLNVKDATTPGGGGGSFGLPGLPTGSLGK
ncbi:Ig-like domain repeat protein [Nocardia sp. CA-145437]|uniref:Ig-like domain-containing protein n=1 Tax=Nocardia sp. CA-145437 TaxID=3239980 RepID=UPI003D97FE07